MSLASTRARASRPIGGLGSAIDVSQPGQQRQTGEQGEEEKGLLLLTTSLPCLLPFLSISPWVLSPERAPAAAHPPAASVAAAAPAAAPEPPQPGSGQSCWPAGRRSAGLRSRTRRGELPRSAAACASRASFPPTLRPRDGGALAPPRPPSEEWAVFLSERHARTCARWRGRAGRRRPTVEHGGNRGQPLERVTGA